MENGTSKNGQINAIVAFNLSVDSIIDDKGEVRTDTQYQQHATKLSAKKHTYCSERRNYLAVCIIASMLYYPLVTIDQLSQSEVTASLRRKIEFLPRSCS